MCYLVIGFLYFCFMKKFYIVFLGLLACINIYSQEGIQQDSIAGRKMHYFNGTPVDMAPQYPGGENAFLEALTKEIKIPEAAIKNAAGENLKAFVIFFIEEDGSIGDITVTKDPGYGIGDEIVRALKILPKWLPGIEKAKPVRTKRGIPINFSL